jgi:outer membrane protein W
MKTKNWIICILLLSMTGFVYGQNVKALELHVGTLNPKGTEAGTLLGGSWGISVDEAVDLSISAFYFWKDYSKETKVAEDVTDNKIITTKQQELEYNTSLIPIAAMLTLHFPIQPPLYLYGGGGISYQFLFNKETNYEDDVSDSKIYTGFGWVLRAGLEYQLGSRSSLIVEAYYNICEAKGNKDKKEGFPVWDEVDITGLGLRAGVRLELF